MIKDFYFSEIGGAWTETDDFFLLQFYQTLRNGNGGLRQILRSVVLGLRRLRRGALCDGARTTIREYKKKTHFFMF